MKDYPKTSFLICILCAFCIRYANSAVQKKGTSPEIKNEFSKFKQLFQYNLNQLTNNYKNQRPNLDKKVMDQLTPHEQSILKEFHQIQGDSNTNVINLSDYLQTMKKYEKIKKKMTEKKKMLKRVHHKLRSRKLKNKKTQKPKLRKMVSPKPKIKRHVHIFLKKQRKHKQRKTKQKKESKKQHNVFTENEKGLLHKLYGIKNRILESPAPRKLPAKGVQKSNRMWGGATYVKLGQEHAPIYVNESPSYLFSAPKFKTNQNGVELPLPDARAFSPKQVPIAATFGTRPDESDSQDYGDANAYQYQGKSNQSIDIKKAWTMPEPGYMPMIQKYPAGERQLIQVDSSPSQTASGKLTKIFNFFRTAGTETWDFDSETYWNFFSARESV